MSICAFTQNIKPESLNDFVHSFVHSKFAVSIISFVDYLTSMRQEYSIEHFICIVATAYLLMNG